MLCTGSRAPLISLLATGTLLIWSKLSNRDKFTYILLVIIGTCYFILFSERFTSGSSDYSNQARILLISKAFECEFNHYIGAGIGSFNYLTTGIDELYYPHNLEIETYIETGIIGLVILALLLYQLFRYRGIDIFNYLLLYYFINAQFSGDIAGNNMFFVIATISIARHTTNYEKNRILLQK